MSRFKQLLGKNVVVLAVTIAAVFFTVFGVATGAWFEVIVAVLLVLLIGVPLVVFAGYLACLPVIAFHELGHLAAGKLVGFKLTWISVSHFLFQKNKETLCISFRRDYPRLMGFTKMATGPNESARSYIIYLLGGLFANLLLLCLVLFADLRQNPWEAWSGNLHPNMGWDDALLLLNIFAISTLLSPAIPHKTQGYASDMAQILSILKNPKLVRLRNRWESIHAHFKNEQRGRDLKEQDVIDSIQYSTTEYEIRISNYYAYDFYLDSGRYELATSAITSAYQVSNAAPSLTESYAQLVCMEYAFIHSLFGNLTVAEEAYALCDKDPTPWPSQKERSLAALLMAQGKPEEAKAAGNRAEELIKGSAEELKPNTQAELDWLKLVFEDLPPAESTESSNEG